MISRILLETQSSRKFLAVPIVGVLVLAGCSARVARLLGEQATIWNEQTSPRLAAGMSKEEVRAAIGPPTGGYDYGVVDASGGMGDTSEVEVGGIEWRFPSGRFPEGFTVYQLGWVGYDDNPNGFAFGTLGSRLTTEGGKCPAPTALKFPVEKISEHRRQNLPTNSPFYLQSPRGLQAFMVVSRFLPGPGAGVPSVERWVYTYPDLRATLAVSLFFVDGRLHEVSCPGFPLVNESSAIEALRPENAPKLRSDLTRTRAESASDSSRDASAAGQPVPQRR